MARGFLMGLVWGTVVSGLGAGALSVAMGVDPDASPQFAAAGDAAGLVTDDTLAEDGVTEAMGSIGASDRDPPDGDADDARAAADPEVPAPEPAPDVIAPADPDRAADADAVARAEAVNPAQPGRRPPPEQAVDLPRVQADPLAAPDAPVVIGADTAPLEQPEIGETPEAALDAPPARGESGLGIEVTSEGPVLPGAQAEAPGLANPDAEPDPALSPLQPPMPRVPDAETALIPDSDNAEDEPDLVLADIGREEENPVAEATPEQDVAPGADAAARDANPAPALERAAEASPDAASPEDAPEQADGDAEAIADSGSSSGIGRPAVSLVERDGAVTQSRLPRIGATGAEPEAAQDDTVPRDAPLARFAAPVVSDPTKPRVAVILIDDGSGPLGPDALGAFPFPVSFAIDPARADAAEIAQAYRDAGFEVLGIARVPEGALASDVEVSLAGTLDAVPGVIGLMEAPEGGLQENRATTTQAASALAASGHGLVLMPKGLNTAQQLAAREGVPSVSVFRDFDGEGQDSRVIRRFLDQAAFRARQDGAVVMLGRLQADTVSALVLWGLQDRASTVSLVPVSQILLNPPSE